ncbi:MAG: 8-amino-7-oxononanoate synthase [Gammaproteobacteria bacterium]|nr:MAG: 8-amino-7-oxononanoate synthase [Gammaproteobacteria bacterium]
MRRRLAEALQARRRDGALRRRPVVDTPSGRELVIDGRRLLAFASNDYLGLANDPRVADAFRQGIDRWGSGSAAAHLITGHTRAHQALEEELAEFTGREAALLFSTGYMANLGTIQALTGRGDLVLEDRLNHASLLDGALLSGARLQRYAHADTQDLARRLQRAGDRPALVVSDGVFSMDGDIAPVAELAAMTRQHDAWLMIDDAHGLGVLGPEGRGTTAGLTEAEVPVLVGTLGKAFGTAGAFVAGSRELVEYLVNFARSAIYTTAMPAALAEATRKALELARSEDWRRERLNELTRQFRHGAAELGLPLLPSTSPIQPLVTGSNTRAVALQLALRAGGIHVVAVRPPTVPEGSARLRITFSAAHEPADVERLLEALDRAWSGLPED